jgi:hypothetical protein
MVMSLKSRKTLMGRCDEQVFAFAGLFLVCSLISALGGSLLALFLFIPTAVAASLWLPGRADDRQLPTGGK